MISDPNTIVVEQVAAALGELRNELVLVGGCAAGLLISDKARPPVRQTVDVDLVVEAYSLQHFYKIADELKSCGFKESSDANNMCRWRRGELILDLMPTNEKILGHSTNRWYTDAVKTAQLKVLPSGIKIRIIAPPLFVATKLDSFHGRGGGDYSHHDMEDIVNLVDGRPELIDEVAGTLDAVRIYIQEETDDLLADASFVDGLPRLLRPDYANQARIPLIIERLRKLAGL